MQTIELLSLAPGNLLRRYRAWRYRRLEEHYLMCAQVEKERADEHLQNVRYYQSKAALARSNRI